MSLFPFFFLVHFPKAPVQTGKPVNALGCKYWEFMPRLLMNEQFKQIVNKKKMRT
jgi:hypothetical protein